MEGGLHVLFAATIFVPPFPCQNRTSYDDLKWFPKPLSQDCPCSKTAENKHSIHTLTHSAPLALFATQGLFAEDSEVSEEGLLRLPMERASSSSEASLCRACQERQTPYVPLQQHFIISIYGTATCENIV